MDSVQIKAVNKWAIKVAVEHVNHTEINFVNTFAQALSIVREVDRAEVGLAADFYHFAMENGPMEIMLEASDLICAVQLANPSGRCFPQPKTDIPGLGTFFQFLSKIGYSGGVSVEATVGDDLEADCRGAVERLNACF
ncbi:MAG: sugar phosphate isomerase/epimerase family protein [Mariniblastus sp.]